MASLQDFQKKALEKGITSATRHTRDVDADSVVGNYVKGYSAEGALKNSVEGLEGFCSYWEEQSLSKLNLSSANEYIDKINTIFSSYRTLRRNLDGTIAYLIGDWLIDCRKRFFPDEDRKTRGNWSLFLKKNLCKDFEKSTAYEFMAIAEKLKMYRQNKLPIYTLKALLRAKNSGVDVESLNVDVISTKEILAMRDKNKNITANNICYRFKQNIDNFIEDINNFELTDFDSSEVSKIRSSLQTLLKILEPLNVK